jgi:hypothetical protein
MPLRFLRFTGLDARFFSGVSINKLCNLAQLMFKGF